MVLSHSQDSREVSLCQKLRIIGSANDTQERPEPKIWHVRWQISQFRFNLLESSNRNVIRGALYAFFMSSWLSDVIAWPFSPGLHRSVVYVLAALLLCPLHFIATGLSIKSPPLFSPPRAPGIWQGSEKGEKAPAPPTVEEPVPRWSTLLYDLYCWLLPTTLLWATACELAKLPPLTLSRAYSLKERVQSMVVLYDLSGPSLRTLLLDSALVFLVYLAACLLLILPTTIAMRRVHASLARFSKAVVPPDEMIRGRTELVEKKYLGAFEALRTFSLRQLPRMMLICGTVYCVMQAIKLIGLGMLVLGFKLMENMYGSTEQYLGFGETFVWYFQRAVFGS